MATRQRRPRRTRLDDLCGALERTYANLDAAPPHSDPAAAARSAPLAYASLDARRPGWRMLAGAGFFRRQTYRLGSLELQLRCYRVRERRGWDREWQTVLSLRKPGWWRRLARRPALLLRIAIVDGKSVLEIERAGAAAAAAAAPDWQLLLSAAQEAQVEAWHAADGQTDAGRWRRALHAAWQILWGWR